jgi:GNAT superfamily N-acetyltransferase
MEQPENVAVLPLTPDRWEDFEDLFGARGACAGCWCMYWRLRRKDFDLMRGESTRSLIHSLVMDNQVPGLLAYINGIPVGWVSLGPRQDFDLLERSRVLKRVDEQPVWSIVCFFVRSKHRRQGITGALIHGAVCYAREQGARILEGYPIVPKTAQVPAVFAYTGFASTYAAAGFMEVARRSPTRPIMRLHL